jgi:GGDEF domain-containing protein
MDNRDERIEPQRAILDNLVATSAVGRTVTPAEIAAEGGPPIEKLGELMHAFGLPSPEPDEQASVQLWVSAVEPGLRERGRDAQSAEAQSLMGLLPVSDALLALVHRRWLEREAVQVALREAPLTPESGSALAAIEVSFLFCDLKDFTAFADRQGDAAAVQIIDRFAAIVTQERGPDVRLTKLLGDGFMCSYPDPELAVEAGARIIDAMRGPDHPGVQSRARVTTSAPQ